MDAEFVRCFGRVDQRHSQCGEYIFRSILFPGECRTNNIFKCCRPCCCSKIRVDVCGKLKPKKHHFFSPLYPLLYARTIQTWLFRERLQYGRRAFCSTTGSTVHLTKQWLRYTEAMPATDLRSDEGAIPCRRQAVIFRPGRGLDFGIFAPEENIISWLYMPRGEQGTDVLTC